MSENVYNSEISYWYDAIMEAGYNTSDHKAAADAIVRILGSRKKVLELGIGTGLLAEQLVEVGVELSGFDFSPDMLEKAEVRLGDRAKLYQQDVLSLDLPETYEAAVSQGGVWVTTIDGNCLDSHITDYEKNLQGLRRVAKHLDDNGLLIVNLGPEQRDLTIQLADGAEYSQRVKFIGENFEKDYFVKKDVKVLAHQHVKYARFSPEKTAKIIEKAGFRKLGIDESKSFVVYEKR
jgi:ubiquinone/menaquinone biosynthesis C-methylase UbiE